MITVKELEHLAKLSRIELTDAEKQSLVKEFDSILGYVDELKKVKVDLDESGRVGAIRNVFREDVSVDTNSKDRDGLIAEAPYREGDFIAVKKIIAQD